MTSSSRATPSTLAARLRLFFSSFGAQRGEPLWRRGLIVWAITCALLGLLAFGLQTSALANVLWAIGTIPVLATLAVSMTRDLLAGRLGVDAIALLSMTAALAFGETLAAIVVAVMYAGGTVLEDYAIARAQRDLKALIDRAPRVAHRLDGEHLRDIDVNAVAIGDILVVRGGEIVPVDGVVAGDVGTRVSIDASVLTGEPLPVMRQHGDALLSGTINAGGVFHMRATAPASSSAYSGIVRLVTAAQTSKAPFIRLADRYALVLLPVTVVLALATWWVTDDTRRALAVLVAATPCPLILAAPVAFVSGVARAARRGILVKGGGPLEALATATTVVFDKTGTLTVGGARVLAIEAAPGLTADDVLGRVASLEQASPHVIAQALVAAARDRTLSLSVPTDVIEDHGSGLSGYVNGCLLRAGSREFVGAAGQNEWLDRAARRAEIRSALTVYVSENERAIGVILMGDTLRAETPRALAQLRGLGISRMVMLTGDRADAAADMAASIDIDIVRAECSPEDKVRFVALERRSAISLMVGDGINDAPALASADVGIAMGARGASASSEAADVVILVDQLDRVPETVAIARRTRSIAVQSIVVGLTLSGVAMSLAAFGVLSPVAAALSQEAIDLAVIVNALRALAPPRTAAAQGRAEAQNGAVSPVADVSTHHADVFAAVDRLAAISDELDIAPVETAPTLIREAVDIVQRIIAPHERADIQAHTQISGRPRNVQLPLDILSPAHRSILHKARLLARLGEQVRRDGCDQMMIRDAQRLITTIELVTRMHTEQEDDVAARASPHR